MFLSELSDLRRFFSRAFFSLILFTMARNKGPKRPPRLHKTLVMAHPSSGPITIVGISASDRNRSCEDHTCCGRSLTLDSVVRFKYCQIVIDDEEETAIEVVSIRGGLDSCRVGFLKRYYIEETRRLDGKVAQIIAFHRDAESQLDRDFDFYQHGACFGAVLDVEYYELMESLQDVGTDGVNGGNNNDNNDNNDNNNGNNDNGNNDNGNNDNATTTKTTTATMWTTLTTTITTTINKRNNVLIEKKQSQYDTMIITTKRYDTTQHDTTTKKSNTTNKNNNKSEK